MSGTFIIFLLTVALLLLSCIVIYQQFSFRKGTQDILKKMGMELAQILDEESDRKIMVFTDQKAVMELSGQINRLLENRQKLKADFTRSQLASRKMLSNISHDIKTPMTVISGYLEILRLQDFADKQMLIKVEQRVQKVIEMINQFFTLAKLESGDSSVEITSININEICRENILVFYEILTQKNFEVDVQIPDDPLFIRGNADSLHRILTNLISNAVHYGSEGKYLGIFLGADKEGIYVDIVDKGKGIDRQSAQNVFDRLYTVEDSRNQNIQGNGLGLAISRNLARQMGGDILLESEPHVKTTFTLKLIKFSY